MTNKALRGSRSGPGGSRPHEAQFRFTGCARCVDGALIRFVGAWDGGELHECICEALVMVR